ncbi:MAG: PKD domain-containing protein [Candidatus Cloacimonetes bacterium]|nr:PKD domain-containing protein [Candidatus Cloacimonadota bacterium]
MKKNWILTLGLILTLTLINCTLFAITVDGNAYLENHTDHSGIEVFFERTAPSSLTYTVYTNASGYYTADIETGIYNITYSKDDYFNEWFTDQTLYINITLSDINLIEHTTILNVPSVFPTIQSAIDHAFTADTVLVQPGTYYENINYNGKNITVGSLFLTTQDTTYISSTIIDGNQSGSVVTFSGGSSNAVLTGFTITNGSAGDGGGIFCDSSSPSIENVTITGNSASYNFGGGIYCGNSSSPSLSNVTITGNSSSNLGGGIGCYNSSPSLSNVTITGNSATDGGGIHCYSSSPNLTNVTITDNNAANYEYIGSGGGIYCSHSSSPSLVNVTITGNNANYSGGGIYCSTGIPSLENVTITGNSATDSGGGIYLSFSSSILDNVTITGNSADYGGGIYCRFSSPSLENTIVSDNTGNYGIFVEEGTPSINYSDFWNNQNGNFYNCGEWVGLNVTTNANGDSCDVYSNIQFDPCFVDTANGDYHLTEISPCIDAGNSTSPLDPDGTVVDMGAYYYHQGDIPPIAEFTSNSAQGYSPLVINFTDLSIQGTGVITDWEWYFDDGDSSSVQNPTHAFYESGDYTITLTVTDENDSTDTEIKTDYITVWDIESNFEVDTTSGYYPSVEVNFTDLSVGNITNWFWDFENDGTYDSFIQNPTFTYTGVGIYSVKLKVSDGTNVDSLVQNNLITVEYVPPAPPTNVQVNIIYPDAVISWTAVDTTIFGTPITPDGYIVSYSENEDVYFYLWFTTETNFIHEFVAQHSSQMFYRVVAFVDLSRNEIEYLVSLNNSREKVKWSEVKQNLIKIRK